MGVPFNEPLEDPPAAHHPQSSSSSSEESTGSEGDSDSSSSHTGGEGPHGYPFSSTSDESEWEDPSEGGVLTLVYRAAECGDEAELRQLLTALSVPLDTRGGDGDTALHLAALYGHLGCARVLLDGGARADIPDDDGAVPLHDAAAGGYEELATVLLDAAPGCANARDADGDTPLHNAARGGATEVVRLLLARGADAALRNHGFQTPAALATAGSDMRRILEDAEGVASAAAALDATAVADTS